MGLRSWVKTTASRDSEFQSQDAAIPEPDLPFTPGQSSPDVEKSDSLSEKERDNIQYTDRTPEKTELTPMEAYKWDVSGEQSPFPEVAACVPVTDDHTLEVNTFRMWVLVTVFVILFSGVNMFFSLRYPSLTLNYVVAQLLVFPVGRLWERLPTWRVGFGQWTFRINPGRFHVKEHAIIVICVNLTATTAYAMGSLVAITSEEFWGQDYGAGFGILYILTTQFLGFGLAGLARRWIVYPGAMIWPASLASTVLFRALHEPQDESPANGWVITRYRFFLYVVAGSFVWYWFPDYIWTGLSSFAFITWIWPNNQKVNAIFGMNSGLGLLPISFDWTVISYAGQPLTTPFWVTANCFAAVAIFYLFIAPILYYSGVWYSDYLPLLSSSTFDNTGASYNITKVVNSDLTFNLEKYKEYSPMYISMAYSISYGLNFAAITGIIVHTYLYNGAEIWAKLRNATSGGEDIHKRLMNRYKNVPEWWYMIVTVVTLGLGIFTIRFWDTQLPVWGFVVVAWGIGVVMMIPEGILQGTTNQRVFLNIITELIAGYAWPGKPLANMMIKFYGYNAVKHGMDFAQDLKLGQYMKVDPRILFYAQIYSSILAAITQVGVFRWMLGHIENLCSSKNTNRFTCAGTKVVYNASLIWGTVGPQRLFAQGQTYSQLMYFFLIGPALVVIFYLLYRRYPNSWLRYVNLPIFFNSAGNIPPANTTQYSLWFMTGLVFNYFIRQRAFQWWKRYNYLLSAGLDTGVAFATIIIFFALSYNSITFDWWGNSVVTMDTKSTPWKTVTKGSYFGPGPGEF
ncbi:OPT oligopeptide transporter [Stereum hirsutum FP-91666 SS1]|uniref:OPT oligopeptide transporter n=1 Tax=Stereum hirsutum (strain FP-91666) TaxID=721885 RepID=UPI000444922B|nr:OPT oligopeptide transporter [Stereum hirsutum FP-91666 SS1]EIM86112.1 OPT oligopeptide transporter [Stereum hirsutum FP-91666 SS1]